MRMGQGVPPFVGFTTIDLVLVVFPEPQVAVQGDHAAHPDTEHGTGTTAPISAAAIGSNGTSGAIGSLSSIAVCGVHVKKWFHVKPQHN